MLLLFLGVALLLAFRAWQQHRKRQAQYQRRAQDVGLKPSQRRLLWQVARKQRRNPVLLLRSSTAFELCVGECAAQQDSVALLEELARIRIRLGFDCLAKDQPVRTTRQLPQGQTLSLWPQDTDPTQAAPCLVVSRHERMLVTSPLLTTPPTWKAGTPLSVRFRRAQDAEYRFATRLLACTPHTLKLQHADQVERLQVRAFFRWETSFPLALLVSLGHGQTRSLEGTVTNISGGGLRLRIEDGIPSGTPVQVDPDHRGPFPLAGVRARVISTSIEAQHGWVRVQFVDLPAKVEAQILRRIFQHQLKHPPAGQEVPCLRRRALQP
ncbi:MAG: PilZ domain-containing protein [Candidatus Latescibacteria bacterium]|nr:PilZ domain-containing protein [Candidatus Latescibacterota bacterium]